MKAKIYINGIGTVNPQGIWHPNFFDEAEEIAESLAMAKQPSYKDLIAPAMIRRMSKGIKMGIFAAQQALDEAKLDQPDAIITGTGLGCLEDSEKFLKNVLDNEEEFLTPTSFIQSTHNTVGAQIALRLGCKGYNFTYVNGATSFESALMDAQLQIANQEEYHILVGGIDEISGHTFTLKQLVGEVKASDVSETLKDSSSPGVNYGEGGTFFVLSDKISNNSYAELLDVKIQNRIDKDDFANFIVHFLNENNLTTADISVLVTGNNGEKNTDLWYGSLAAMFNDAAQVYYKHLVGHSDVASAFGLATAAYILKNNHIPEQLFFAEKKSLKPEYILCYNQNKGVDHSFILVKAL